MYLLEGWREQLSRMNCIPRRLVNLKAVRTVSARPSPCRMVRRWCIPAGTPFQTSELETCSCLSANVRCSMPTLLLVSWMFHWNKVTASTLRPMRGTSSVRLSGTTQSIDAGCSLEGSSSIQTTSDPQRSSVSCRSGLSQWGVSVEEQSIPRT